MLFPRVPGFQVSWLAIGTMTIAWAGAFGFVLRLVIKAQRQPALSGVEHMVGAEGVVKTELAPRGIVTVEGENWTAEAVPGPIPAGERIEVLEVQGLTLRVRRREPERRT
jgi:membrane-bound serine protease (ClpP class)